MNLPNNNRVSLSVLYAPLTRSASLRLSAFGNDATLSAIGADGPDPTREVEQLQPDDLSSGSITALAVLLSLAFLPWIFFRRVPTWLAVRMDQFSLKHGIDVGESLIAYPTQFGTVVTWSFLCLSLLVAVLLSLAPNTQTVGSLVPPSSFKTKIAALGDFQLTLRAHVSPEAALHECVSSVGSGVRFDSSVSFSSSFTTHIESTSPTTCSMSADCIGCSLTGIRPSLEFSFPFDSQLIEYEIWVNSATPGGWSRRYGVIQQLPGQLLDAKGEIHMSLMPSYYMNDVGLSAIRTGFELEYQQYLSIASQSMDEFNAKSRVALRFLFQQSDIYYQTVVSSKQSNLQLITVVLSAIGSIFAGFAILFGFIEKRILKYQSGPMTKDHHTGEVTLSNRPISMSLHTIPDKDASSMGASASSTVDEDFTSLTPKPLNNITSSVSPEASVTMGIRSSPIHPYSMETELTEMSARIPVGVDSSSEAL